MQRISFLLLGSRAKILGTKSEFLRATINIISRRLQHPHYGILFRKHSECTRARVLEFLSARAAMASAHLETGGSFRAEKYTVFTDIYTRELAFHNRFPRTAPMKTTTATTTTSERIVPIDFALFYISVSHLAGGSFASPLCTFESLGFSAIIASHCVVYKTTYICVPRASLSRDFYFYYYADAPIERGRYYCLSFLLYTLEKHRE